MVFSTLLCLRLPTGDYSVVCLLIDIIDKGSVAPTRFKIEKSYSKRFPKGNSRLHTWDFREKKINMGNYLLVEESQASQLNGFKPYITR